jgi:hypothetical protein
VEHSATLVLAAPEEHGVEVTDDAGGPVAGAAVTVRIEGADAPAEFGPLAEGRTGSGGACRLPMPAAKAIRIEARSKDGALAGAVVLPGGAAGVEDPIGITVEPAAGGK